MIVNGIQLCVYQNNPPSDDKGRKMKKKSQMKRKSQGEVIKERDDECFSCGDGGQVVSCKRPGCPKVYHADCLKGVAHRMRSAAPRRVAPCLSNSNTLFSMCVRTPAAPFGVCPQRPATTQNAVQIPAAPQSAIGIVLY